MKSTWTTGQNTLTKMAFYRHLSISYFLYMLIKLPEKWPNTMASFENVKIGGKRADGSLNSVPLQCKHTNRKTSILLQHNNTHIMVTWFMWLFHLSDGIGHYLRVAHHLGAAHLRAADSNHLRGGPLRRAGIQ